MAVARDELLRSAEALVARGRIEAAIKEYRKLLEEGSSDTGLLNLVGDLLARIKQYDEAIEHYKLTANQFAQEGFFVKAIAVYKKIHRLDPTRHEVYEKLAELYHRQGLLKEAVRQYQLLADYYTQHDDKEGAAKAYRRLVDLDPKELGYHTKLAELFKELGQPDKVAMEYRDIARFMLAHGRVDEALKILYHGLEVDAQNAEFAREAISLLEGAGLADAVLTFREEVEERSPGLLSGGALEDSAAPVGFSDTQEFEGPTYGSGTGERWVDTARVATGGPVSGDSPKVAEPISAPTAIPAGQPPTRSDASLVSPDEASEPEEAAPAASDPGLGKPGSEADELLAEAQVFVKYGLKQKALDRLAEVLQISPRNLSAHNQLISLLLEQESFDQAGDRANRMSTVAREQGDLRLWVEIRERLISAGFSLDGDQIVGTPGEASLSDGEGPVDPEEPPDALFESQVLLEITDPLLSESDELRSLTAPSSDLNSLTESDSASIIERDSGESPETGSAGSSFVLGSGTPEQQVADGKVREGESFDLSAALGTDLDEASRNEPVEPVEASVAEIVEDFRKGVSENLSREDSDTHYNLGIAFLEMGLLDDAIAEFQTAAKIDTHRMQSCSMLGRCMREKGLVEQAIKWYRLGLGTPDVGEQEELAFLYEIADCHAALGDRDSAYDAFAEIYGIDSGYRDVVVRLTEFRR